MTFGWRATPEATLQRKGVGQGDTPWDHVIAEHQRVGVHSRICAGGFLVGCGCFGTLHKTEARHGRQAEGCAL